MAGSLLARELTEFSVATPDDDAELRALLRETPIPGPISISLEREPNYFHRLPNETTETIIARTHDRIVCLGSCATRDRFINGEPRKVGYLGNLRLRADVAGRADILRRGYRKFRELAEANPADFYFTAIASENHRARRFLEANLRGMPIYKFLTEFITIVLPTKPAAHQPLIPLNNADYQLAAASLDAPPIWDQRAFKQTVIRNYSAPLKTLRPILNLLLRPQLPTIGATLENAFVLNAYAQSQLIPTLLSHAYEAGLKLLTFGFAATDPRLKQFSGGRRYSSRFYIVRWPDLGGSARELDARVVNPEVALL